MVIAAHGNSLRALIKYLDNIPDDEIVELNVPDGHPARVRTGRRPDADSALLPGR